MLNRFLKSSHGFVECGNYDVGVTAWTIVLDAQATHRNSQTALALRTGKTEKKVSRFRSTPRTLGA
jgi:hypothetical protein